MFQCPARVVSAFDTGLHIEQRSQYVLVRNTVKRAIVIESEVSSMDYVVGPGLLCQIVQGLEISYTIRASVFGCTTVDDTNLFTSNISYAQNASSTVLNDASIVW